MSQVRGPIRIGPVGRQQLDYAAGPGDPVQLGHDRHWFFDMLDNMAANDFIELVVAKWIWQIVQVVYHIGVGARINVHADGTGSLVSPTTYIQYPASYHSRPGSHMRRAYHIHAHSGEGLFRATGLL